MKTTNSYYYKPGGDDNRSISMSKKSFVLLIVIIVALASAISFGGTSIANYISGSSGSSTNVTGTGYKLEDATDSSMTVQEITKKVQDSVVEIKTESSQQGGWVGQYVTEGAGSGVIIKSNGYILTNNHVISDASTISVTVGKKSYKATVVGTDSENDIAVLKINAKNLTAATYGNSDQIDVGDMSVVIGNPLGELGGSVAAGIISAKNREVTLENQDMTLIQTDASVNPGNSGGGMFNDNGQLIGIVVAKSSSENTEGLGFAIPINVAAKSASNIMKGKSSASTSSSKANSGMSYQDLTDSSDAQSAGVSETGIYIAEIYSSNAKQAGFQSGDLVYKVDGKKISSFSTLKKIIQSHKAGDKIKYVVVRDNQTVSMTLTLVSEDDSDSSTNGSSDSGSDSYDSYGSGNGSDSYGNDQNSDSYGW
ncbi:MAG: trypsin-like peptidase domain-containing protein [Eubacteriaceae bacterium]|nr:trypsin-like peptidase domain-containing protein [Eubacteriaceae bacterium]